MRVVTAKRRRQKVSKPAQVFHVEPCLSCSATGKDWFVSGKRCLVCDGRGVRVLKLEPEDVMAFEA